MFVLGISCYFHDAAAALLKDGQLVAAAEEERFSRKKHDYSYPSRAIDFCLKQGGIRKEEVDYIVFFEKPFVKFERLLTTAIHTFPRSLGMFQEAMQGWLLDKLWIKERLRSEFGLPSNRILFSEHHISHAASAFYCSPFEEAATLTADAVGEWTTVSIGEGKGTDLKLLRELRFPHSLGLLYSAFTAYLGFEVNEGEYKVMGMAPYGKPNYMDKIWKLLELHDDASFSLNMDYFTYHYSRDRMFNSKFEELFGGPARPSPERGVPDPRSADIAASIQRVTEEVMLALTKEAHRLTGQSRLCLAGGIALNSVANARILRETPFEDLFIQPAAGDGGGALGAALYGYHGLLGNPRSFVMEHAAWGQAHDDAEIEAYLRAQNANYTYVEDEESLLRQTIDDLTRGKVVGWLQGRFEFGPRALGNRSILADPRRPEMKDLVNSKIKFREAFRPFAPSVLAEEAERHFDLPKADLAYPARFMLYVVPVREEKRSSLAAITHVDGSARPQTVHEELHPLYHRLISGFGEATGVPVVLNTSFNLRGEPIVNTPGEAFSTFMRSGLDVLVLGNYRIIKP